MSLKFFRRLGLLGIVLLLGLGWPVAFAQPTSSIVINEVDADTPGTDTLEFVELYDGGTGSTALDGLVLVFYNGNGDIAYAAFDLDGYTTDAEGYFVLGNASVAGVDRIFSNDLLQNGADAVALYTGDAADFPNGTAVTTVNLIDALVYDTNDADDAGLLALLNAGQPQVNENGANDAVNQSNQRCPNGTGGQRNTSSYIQATPTPGAANACTGGVVGEFGACGDPATFIHAIQGSGSASPLNGTAGVVIEGVVVGDFQNTTSELRGFFVQEEDAQADADSATSEGIFVFDNGFGVDVAVGNVVRVQGTVTEFFGLTELNNLNNVAVCATTGSASAAALALPVANLAQWEQYEGMLVTIAQTLHVTGNYNQGQFGEVDLATGGRLYNPTNVTTPGAAANALQESNNRRRILLDDGSTVSNPLPLPPYLGLDTTLRAGDTIPNLTGVLSYGFGAYRIHPTNLVTFTRVNSRDAAPPPVGGTLKVASFNVLNYFNGNGLGGGFPTPRGADTPEEFARQRAKIIDAIVTIDADVVGLMEIENDAPPNSAIEDLVSGLNTAAGPGTYAFINTGIVGGDAIRVALIYKPATVTPLGTTATLTNVAPFNVNTRPPLAQAFEEIATGKQLVVAVNHFKSKSTSGCPSSGPNADNGDGQGCWNGDRVQAAQQLLAWLDTNPTQTGITDTLIIGDLNAYAQEDPIGIFEDAGYTNLIAALIGDEAYSYVFDGQAGYLDHALASTGLESKVAGVVEWHINADEPRALDYNDFNQPTLYSPDSYRSSDHDPVVIGLNLATSQAPNPPVYLPIIVR